MWKAGILLLVGLVVVQLAPNACAQVVPRVIYTCDACSTNGTLKDTDLKGALAMKSVAQGTYLFAVDGPNNTSVTYQATAVNQLDYPLQPNRELPGGRHLVMKKVAANPFTKDATLFLKFYREQPVGWRKEFVPDPN